MCKEFMLREEFTNGASVYVGGRRQTDPGDGGT